MDESILTSTAVPHFKQNCASSDGKLLPKTLQNANLKHHNFIYLKKLGVKGINEIVVYCIIKNVIIYVSNLSISIE